MANWPRSRAYPGWQTSPSNSAVRPVISGASPSSRTASCKFSRPSFSPSSSVNKRGSPPPELIQCSLLSCSSIHRPVRRYQSISRANLLATGRCHAIVTAGRRRADGCGQPVALTLPGPLWHNNVPTPPGRMSNRGTMKNGLYSIHVSLQDGRSGKGSGVVVFRDGKILGGDAYLFYTGTYTTKGNAFKGEVLVQRHTCSPDAIRCSAARARSASASPAPSPTPRRDERDGSGRQGQPDLQGDPRKLAEAISGSLGMR